VTAGRTSVADVTTRAWIGLNVSILEERGSGSNVNGLEAVRTARSKKLKIIIKSAEVAHRGGVRLNDAAADGAVVVVWRLYERLLTGVMNTKETTLVSG
jgi:hypothetical protein